MAKDIWILKSSDNTNYPILSKIINKNNLKTKKLEDGELYDIIDKPIDVTKIPALVILNDNISISFVKRLSVWRNNLRRPGAYLSPIFIIVTKSKIDVEAQREYDPHDQYDIKFCTIDELSSPGISENILNRALKHWKIAENGILIGDSKPMAKIKTLISKFKDFQYPVLITGQPGTGKEIVARALHSESNRSKHPFIAVNAATIQNTLFESIMYGYTKGAYTGADSDKDGLCHKAHLGTLFLDEIGRLPKESQPKLLRFLQDLRVRKIGSLIKEAVDVRIIAATNKNLYKMIESNEFASDLFDRLNFFDIEIPPLAKRKEDIPQLIKHFCLKYSLTIGVGGSKHFSRQAEAALIEFNWPANIRQLEFIIMKVQTLSESDEIGYQELPKIIRDYYESNKHALIQLPTQSTLPEIKIDLNYFNDNLADYDKFTALFEEKGWKPRIILQNIKPLLQSVNIASFNQKAGTIQTKLDYLIKTIDIDSRDALNTLKTCLNPDCNRVFNLDTNDFHINVIKILVTFCTGKIKKTSNLLRVLGYVDNTSSGYLKKHFGLDKNNNPPDDTLAKWYNKNFRP